MFELVSLRYHEEVLLVVHKTMKAAVLEKFNEPLVVREFEKPTLGSGEVLVRMLAAGVCGSDI
ncbi:MAG: hypothetical protein QME62_10955, partial [Armatimonadota bacterium]|nr:hypothetical protein [Armatimonadota bacterium]